MDWIDAKMPPTDHRQKLVMVENVFQNRTFYALAYFDNANRWGSVGGRVLKYMDLQELIKDGEAVDRLLKAEADLSKDGLDYIERARAVRIVRGLE